MKKYLIPGIIIFFAVWGGSILSRNFGWYFNYWFVDIILHVLSGVMFALFWIALTKAKTTSVLVLMLGTLGMATLGSFLWECWEYWGYLLKPDLVRFYIPEISDSLGDIASGLLGGLLVSPFVRRIAIMKR